MDAPSCYFLVTSHCSAYRLTPLSVPPPLHLLVRRMLIKYCSWMSAQVTASNTFQRGRNSFLDESSCYFMALSLLSISPDPVLCPAPWTVTPSSDLSPAAVRVKKRPREQLSQQVKNTRPKWGIWRVSRWSQTKSYPQEAAGTHLGRPNPFMQRSPDKCRQIPLPA